MITNIQMEDQMTKALIALLALGLATPAFAQNAPMPRGVTNAPPGTSYSGQQDPNLPPPTTNQARPGELNNHASAAEAAARYKIEQAGFHDVKGLSRSPDGVWSGRAVKGGLEMAVSLEPDGNIVTD